MTLVSDVAALEDGGGGYDGKDDSETLPRIFRTPTILDKGRHHHHLHGRDPLLTSLAQLVLSHEE